ncbi:MAG: nitronate monooxygenase, partial [Lentisphaerae bacterium]|nr:nitronate monooxygenase [Lentisphaerota bacterium]
QLGVVAGTALDEILARRLQEGDPGGHMRRALEHFPMRRMAQSIIDQYFISGGKSPNAPFRTRKLPSLEGNRESTELCIAGNFVEVFLAREGHDNPVGINYLEKIQFPHLPSIYGAMLAGVAVIIMGAGIPLEIPDAIDALLENQPAAYTVNVTGAARNAGYRMKFDPKAFLEEGPPATLRRPAFLPIVSSVTLANVLIRKTGGRLAGFVVEGPLAGGHNAPPRGAPVMTDDGQPIYGPRDVIDLPSIAKLGLPFWLAGCYGSPEGLHKARAAGAAGIQVGTAFALCRESSLKPSARQALIRKALTGKARIFTDPIASPTGFPFKVAALEGTLSEQDVYEKRQRICDLGFLRDFYLRPDGKIGYRCPAEPIPAFLAKGGKLESTIGRKCLCNSLVANIGLPQIMADGSKEKCLVTLGDDFSNIGRFCSLDNTDYSAADVIRIISG